MRKCVQCREYKRLDQFSLDRSRITGMNPRCRVCGSQNTKQWRRANPERAAEIDARAQAAVKESAINVYSNGEACCACCGQADMDVLCLDHINDDGAHHRKVMGLLGYRMYLWARRNDYPPVLQVLCLNCNHKKRIIRSREPHCNVSLERLRQG